MKPKVIVFGAGHSGQVYFKKQTEYEVIAFTDNDKSKHGAEIEGIPVISPSSIPNYSYDYVVIASGHVKPIKKQLQNEINIKLDKIIVPSKDLLKIVSNPFEDETTFNFATKSFKEIVKILNKENCQYFIDYGTLLGFVRDGSIIRWDDDIDFSVLRENYESVKNVIEKNIEKINEELQCDWKIEETFNINKQKSALILYPTNTSENILPFHISLMIVDIKDSIAFHLISSVPKEHFEDFETIEVDNQVIRVPNKYEKYLTLQYGDWKTPVRGTSFDIYNSEVD